MFRRLLRPIQNNKSGLALLIAIFSMTLLLFLAVEVSYDTNVEYIVASQKMNRLKAYYAAKAGVEMSLLRIMLYQQALQQYGEQLGDQKGLLESIWNFPLAWPPSKFLPEDLNRVDKDQITSAEKESTMKGSYITSIESESGKIDLNDLASPSDPLRKATQSQVLNIFTRELEQNEEFQKEYRGYEFESLVNHMMDWVDEGDESLVGGSEKTYYREMESDFIPPNQPFKTLDELYMVATMKDDFVELLKKRCTLLGIKGVNVNQASKEVLKSLSPDITDDVIKEILDRRNNPDKGGPFKNDDDFLDFIGRLGVRENTVNESGLPLVYDAIHNFKISAIGEFAGAKAEIVAMTLDYDQAKERLVSQLDKDEKKSEEPSEDRSPPPAEESPPPSDTGGTDPKKKERKPIKGRPNVVFWEEY